MQQVVHLIPYHGIGGVESAAATMRSVQPTGFAFRVETVFAGAPPPLPFQAVAALLTVLRLWRQTPDVLIVSLWRACAVGLLLKLLRPRMKLVLFLHSAAEFHIVDRWFNRAAARRAHRIWADSSATLAARVPTEALNLGRVISFRTARIQPHSEAPPKPHFIFWGRLHRVKRLDRALQIFARIHEQKPDARFTLIGPDGGALAEARAQAATLGVAPRVEFLEGRPFAKIAGIAADASFFLQTSEVEGMAASVVEAMQLGLVPIVTPVGEIAAYARDGQNAVVIQDEAAATADVLALLNDPARYSAMHSAAIATWHDAPLYSDAVIAASREALGTPEE